MTDASKTIDALEKKIRTWHARAEHCWGENEPEMAQECLDHKWHCVVKLAKLQKLPFPEHPEDPKDIFVPPDPARPSLSARMRFRNDVPTVADGSSNDFKIFQSAKNFTADEANQLEDVLRENAEDITSRIKLLGYYFFKRDANEWFRHSIWITRNHPTSQFAGHVPPLDTITAEHISDLAAVWHELCSGCSNPEILANAGAFFSNADDVTAATCYLRAEELEPKNPRWSKHLFHAYWNLAENSPQVYVPLAICQGEKALEKEDHPGEHRGLLEQLFRFSLEHNQLVPARKFAKRLLAFERKTFRGSFFEFRAHVCMGLVELREGKIGKAESRLMKAALCEVAQSSDLKLASELLQAGRREVVQNFLEECKFHSVGKQRKQIVQWSQDLRDGLTPELRFSD
jgi:hypothetical protein